jgi:hypothetical protein
MKKIINKFILILCMMMVMVACASCRSADECISEAQSQGMNYYKVDSVSLEVFGFLAAATAIVFFIGSIGWGIVGLVLTVCYVAFEYDDNHGGCFLMFSNSSEDGYYKPIK